MSKFVVDASALLALVNQEPRQETMAEILPNALVSAVNLSELVAKLTDQAIPDKEINEVLAELALTVMAFDEAQGLIAGQ